MGGFDALGVALGESSGMVGPKAAFDQLKKEYPDWEPGDLWDAVNSVSYSMSPAAAAVQRRYQELRGMSKEPSPYKTLNDASVYASELAPGKIEVWYMRPATRRTGLTVGYEAAKETGILPDPKDLEKTHILLGKVVGGKTFDDLWMALQGDEWSPKGEARGLISSKGLYHTSMSVGDVFRDGNTVVMVDALGFVDLATGKKVK